jgi:hypothetical protein
MKSEREVGLPSPELNRQTEEELPLSKAAQLLLEECRMVLPGIQAVGPLQFPLACRAALARKVRTEDRGPWTVRSSANGTQ